MALSDLLPTKATECGRGVRHRRTIRGMQGSSDKSLKNSVGNECLRRVRGRLNRRLGNREAGI